MHENGKKEPTYHVIGKILSPEKLAETRYYSIPYDFDQRVRPIIVVESEQEAPQHTLLALHHRRTLR